MNGVSDVQIVSDKLHWARNLCSCSCCRKQKKRNIYLNWKGQGSAWANESINALNEPSQSFHAIIVILKIRDAMNFIWNLGEVLLGPMIWSQWTLARVEPFQSARLGQLSYRHHPCARLVWPLLCKTSLAARLFFTWLNLLVSCRVLELGAILATFCQLASATLQLSCFKPVAQSFPKKLNKILPKNHTEWI